MASEYVQPAAGLNEAETPLQNAVAHINRMRNFRRSYDPRRAAHYRQYIGQRDARTFPDNITKRSNFYFAYPHSNVETVVSRVSDAFFSFDPFFEVRPRGASDAPRSEAMQLVLPYVMKRAKFAQAFEALVKNTAIYDVGAIKVDWDHGFDWVIDPQPVLAMQKVLDEAGNEVEIPIPDPQTGGPIVIGTRPIRRQVKRNRPKFTVVDVFDLLLDPDGGLVAHCTEKTMGDLLREQAASGDGAYFPQALAEIQTRLSGVKDADNVLIRLAELWDERAGTCTVLVYNDPDAIHWKDLRAAYRGANLSGYKRQLYGGPPIVLWHGENQFAHKRAPILWTSYIKLTGEPYGMGAIEPTSDLVEGFNTMANMIIDNWNLGINRRYAYNTDVDIDHQALNNFNVPGGKVGIAGDPNKSIMPLPFFTPQKGDYAILDVMKGMIEVTSGISDFYSRGIGSPTGNRTATGIASILNESNFRFRMFIRNLELDVLQPLLAMTASNIQQFVDDAFEVRVTDGQAQIPKWPVVQPEELLGNFDFEIVAGSYATNKVIRQRQLLAFVNFMGQSPYFNWYGAAQEMAKVMELPGAYKMLYTPEQVAQMQQEQLAQQVKLMILEKMLDTEAQARLTQSKPQTSKDPKTGRPRTTQFEGKIPGAGLTSAIRGMAQDMGAGSLGLEGLGEVNIG